NKMDEIEQRKMVIKCLNMNNVKKILLNFELTHHKLIPKKMSLEEFLPICKLILERYQGKAGGFLIEDNDWVIHKPDSAEFEVKSNELLFVNTLDLSDSGDNETEIFLN